MNKEFCFDKLVNELDPFDFETFKNTIDFFCDNGGIKEISLSGGEPLLHPDIIEMIEFCKQKNTINQRIYHVLIFFYTKLILIQLH